MVLMYEDELISMINKINLIILCFTLVFSLKLVAENLSSQKGSSDIANLSELVDKSDVRTRSNIKNESDSRDGSMDSDIISNDCDIHKSERCAVQILKDIYQFRDSQSSFKASKGSIFIKEYQRIRLVKGVFFIQESYGDQIIETSFGELVENQKNLWILVSFDQIVIRNTGYSDVSFKKRDGDSVVVPIGFEIWISGFNEHKKIKYGMIKPIDLKNHFRNWYLFFEGNKEKFYHEVKEAKERWGNLLERSTQIYRDSVDSKIEAQHKLELENQRRRNIELSNQKKYRDLLLEKAFGY